MTKWEQLPIDIFLIIFGKYLSVGDILNLRRTCRLFLSITHVRNLWYTLLHAHVLEKNIPVPGLADRPIDSLSVGELEHFTRSAMRLRRNWSSPSPAATRQINLPGSGSQSRNTHLEFLHRRGRRWLLSVDVILDPPHQMFNVQCWDVEVSPPACVARRQLAVLGSFAVNTDHTSSALIALQCPHTEIWGFNFSATDPDSAFVTMRAFHARVGDLHVFSGSRILAHNGDLRYIVWDIHNPDHEIDLQNPESSQRERLLAAVITEEVAILFRIPTVEIYPLSFLRRGVVAGTIIHPVAQHHWPWRMDNVCVAEQFRWQEALGRQPAAINVLIRFGSWYPWPINVLHHYMLHPNKSYIPSNGVNANNNPYSISPVFMQSIASPVRLFASSPMILGLYGTALWLDSHTEDYFGYVGRGQRLAGRILVAAESQSNTMIDTADPSHQSPSSGMASIVFSVREADDWICLAIDEEEGRVAVGSATLGATTTLLEYA